MVWGALGTGLAAAWLLMWATGGLPQWLLVGEGKLMVSIAGHRPSWVTSFARPVQGWLFGWGAFVIGWAGVGGALAFKRVRHAALLVVCMVTSAAVLVAAESAFLRPRPFGVEILGRWDGHAHPDLATGALAAAVVGAVLVLAPDGPLLARAWAVAAVLVGAFAAAGLYLGVANPTDVAAAVIVGVVVPVLLFRVAAPRSAFPISYARGGKSAHLEVAGAREAAIREGMRDQLGLSVVSMKPVGLTGSGGSTPLMVTVADGDGSSPEASRKVFAKLLSTNHLRADRNYKLVRSLAYGRLEDERGFNSVRRLAEREDYLGRLARDAGIPLPAPLGVVEVTPEREYLVVTEFLDGAVELDDVAVDDALVDRALGLVRKLWDGGLAHRDVKPANVMVREGDAFLIDVGFAELRPSPWRQAIDLANMMLVLALRSDAEHVYRRALQQFTADDIAEAFAATRGITLPSQLRERMESDGRDLVGEFRALGPARRPIPIQRWSVRRVAMLGLAFTAALVTIAVTTGLFRAAGLLP